MKHIVLIYLQDRYKQTKILRAIIINSLKVERTVLELEKRYINTKIKVRSYEIRT